MNKYHFEDLEIGTSASFCLTITPQMLENFRDLSQDFNPLHTDTTFAKKQGYKDKVVYGLLTSSFISKLVGVLLPGKYCLLQSVNLEYKKPAYVGDQLTISGVVEQLHSSVKTAIIKITIVNQNKEKIVKGKVQIGFLEYLDEE